ncbi:MAG: hypothetical protein ACE5JM_16795, partial [Armatimonadota bacterium]
RSQYRVRALYCLAVCALLMSLPMGAEGAQRLLTWAYVEAVDGRNILLDDGSILRLGAGATIRKADGSTGATEDLERGAKIVFETPHAEGLESLQVFPPRGRQEIHLYDLPTERGGASGAPTPVEGRLWPKSVAAVTASYLRNKYWERFETRVLYQPTRAQDAPAKALFAVLDDLGAPLVETVVPAGETRHIALGFSATASPRIILQARPVGEGELRQGWCWWLDPHFVGAQPAVARWTVALSSVEALTEQLRPALADERAGKVAVAVFSAARGTDAYALQDLQDDLFVVIGQNGATAGKYAGKGLAIGAPLGDKDRDALKKLGATSVLVGSVSQRTEGTIVNAALVHVESGAILGTATAKQ